MATATADIFGRPDARPAEAPITDADQFMAEVRDGAERLVKMSPEELRALIARRVELLETTLKEREARRKALEEANMASKILDLRRERAKRIYRQVNVGSMIAAIASSILIVASLV
jgi:hypothetical protein